MVAPTAATSLDTALAVAASGIAVLPLKPGEKAPLSSTQGFYSASHIPERITELFAGAPEGAGLGIAPGACHIDGGVLLVLDADTDEAFALLRGIFGDPTVTTGGRGAHWYVFIPGDGLPNGLTKTSAKHLGIDLIGTTSGGYVCAPPTHIAGRERPYEWVGSTITCPPEGIRWLRDLAAADLAKRQQREAKKNTDADHTNRDEWMRSVEWDTLLTAAHWTFADLYDSCGCPVWTHPYGTDTKRSATAHVEGCGKAESDHPGGALHLWSSTAKEHLGGFESLSKFNFAIEAIYDGDVSAFYEGEDIERDGGEFGFGAFSGGFDPRELHVDAPNADLPDTPVAAAAPQPAPAQPAQQTAAAAPQSPTLNTAQQAPKSGTTVTGRCKADGTWIRTATDAAQHGWSTPVPKRSPDDESARFSPWDATVFPLGHPCAPDLLHRIFDFNDFTRTIFQNARAKNPVRTGPVALLMSELVRGGMRADPAFMPMEGTPLSFYVVRFGDSGKGKSVAMKTCKWTYMGHPMLQTTGTARAEEDRTYKIGSGQVLSDLLSEEVPDEVPDGKGGTKTVMKRVQANPCRVWLEEPEFRSLLKRAKGETSIIFDVLNEAWAGENPGAATRGNGWVDLDNPFNVFLTGGMQTYVWSLFVEQITGFIQRCFMVGVSDPWRRTSDVIVDPPTPGYVVPQIPAAAMSPGFFTLPPEVYDALEDADDDAAFEFTGADDEWETHMTQVRIRLACLLALRTGTTAVTTEMWEWTALLLEHHRRVRAWVMAMEERHKNADLISKGAELARVDAARKAESSRALRDTAQEILDVLGKSATRSVTKREIQRGVKNSLKDHIDTALHKLEREGLVTIAPGGRKDSLIITLVPQDVSGQSNVA